MPKQFKYHRHLVLLPHDLYWRVFREIKRREARHCKRISFNEFTREALEEKLSRKEGEE